MTYDELLDALGEVDPVPVEAITFALAHWDDAASKFERLLGAYVDGDDLSERTELALYTIVHLLGEQAHTASFVDLCRLGQSEDKLGSVFGSEGVVMSYPSILASTFDGDPAPLVRLVELDTADEYTRCEALLAFAYLACKNRIAESVAYETLAKLPARLGEGAGDEVWWGYAKAVAVLGFAGLSAGVEAAFDSGKLSVPDYSKADFWRELRDTQANGRELSDSNWANFEPFGTAIDQLSNLLDAYGDNGDADPSGEAHIQEPIRNPLRDVGRNDPCPCGSGKKYKKCCLQAGTV